MEGEVYNQVFSATRALEYEYNSLFLQKQRLELNLFKREYGKLRKENDELRETLEGRNEDLFGMQQELEGLKIQIQSSLDGGKELEGEYKYDIEQLKKENAKNIEELKSTYEEKMAALKGSISAKVENGSNEVLHSALKEVQEKNKELLKESQALRGEKIRLENLLKATTSERDASLKSCKDLESSNIKLRMENAALKGIEEKCELLNANNSKVNEIIAGLDKRDAKIDKLHLEVCKLRDEGVRLREPEKVMKEKDGMISILKDHLKQKEDIILLQKRLISLQEDGENIANNPAGVSSETHGATSMQEDNPISLAKEPLPAVKDTKKDPMKRPTKRKTVTVKKVMSKRKRDSTPPNTLSTNDTPVPEGRKLDSFSAKKEKDGGKPKECVPPREEGNSNTARDPKRKVLLPENTSFFANLTFTDSSPAVKKDVFRDPKKRLM
jgi:chromosome segregation ATPase